jgi:hypothetical protein
VARGKSKPTYASVAGDALDQVKPFIDRLDKPIGIYLLLWPTLWALWIAVVVLRNVVLIALPHDLRIRADKRRAKNQF